MKILTTTICNYAFQSYLDDYITGHAHDATPPRKSSPSQKPGFSGYMLLYIFFKITSISKNTEISCRHRDPQLPRPILLIPRLYDNILARMNDQPGN